ncbi:MAG: heme ABC exporter ATP-binding protein CcmA [Parvularculaceae bacterium]|nr:heme ABC exporter ATP-binding protein CcmA [Parvularculaceae bacterium]
MAFEMGLQCEDVTVQRGGRDVLSSVTLSLAAGEALQLRGGNGSGKTSLLRAVAGLAKFDGEITFARGVQTLDPGYIRSHEIHYIGMESGLAPRLTVKENVSFLSQFYGADPRDSLEQLGLARHRDRKLGALSSGQQRRLSLLRLMLDPRALWLLDEPFVALDDDGQMIVRTLIDVHRERGGVVIAALHDAVGLPRAKTLKVTAP